MQYDAFISYSHAADRAIAPALRDALHKLAKPWYQRRAAHVFLDQSSLAANPALWPHIEQAISESNHFILLCSPVAATSSWVARELQCWFAHGSPERLLLVLTEGELSWNERTGDFDWERSNVLPDSIRGNITTEPSYIDMRWARSEIKLSLSDPRFLDAAVSLAAPIRGIAKDDLASEEIRQHRRTRRIAWVVGVSLSVLLTVATFASIGFMQRGQELMAQLTESERARILAQGELARRLNAEGNTGQALTTLSAALALPFDLESANLTLAAAAREVELELKRTLFRGGNIAETRFSMKPVDEIETVVLSSDGTRLAVHKSQISIGNDPENNKVEIFHTESTRKLATFYLAGGALVSTMSFVGDGRLLYVRPTRGQGMVVDADRGERVASISRHDVDWVGPESARLFGYDESTGLISVIDLSSGTTVTKFTPPDTARLRRFSFTEKSEVATILYTDGSMAMLAPWESRVRRHSPVDAGRIVKIHGPLPESDSILISTETETVAYLDPVSGVIEPVAGMDIQQRVPAFAAVLPGDRVAYVEREGSSDIIFSGTSGTTSRYIDGQVEWLAGTPAANGVLVRTAAGIHWVPAVDGSQLVSIAGAADPMTQSAFSARTGLLVVGHRSGTIRVRRAPNMNEVLVLTGHTARVTALSLSEDGARLVSASDDGTVRHWWVVPPTAQFVVEPREWTEDGRNNFADRAGRRMALAPNGQWVALRDGDHRISIRDADGKKRSEVNLGGSNATLDFGFTPDGGRMFLVDDSGTVEIYNMDGTAIGSWGDISPSIDVYRDVEEMFDVSPHLAFDSSGSLLVTTADFSDVYLWDLSSPAFPKLLAEDVWNSRVNVRTRVRFEGSTLFWSGDVDSQVWLPNAPAASQRDEMDTSWELLAVGTRSGRAAVKHADGVRILPNAGTGDRLVDIITPLGVTHAWFSTDGARLLTANEVNIDLQNLTVWSAIDGQMLSRVGGGENLSFGDVRMNVDGSRALTRPILGGPTDLWNLDTGERLVSLRPDFVKEFGFSPDGRRFFVASSLSNEGQGGVWLYDSDTGAILWKELGVILDPSGVSFSPDSAYLIVHDRKNVSYSFSPLFLVDADSGTLVGDLSRPAGRILDAHFDADGRWLFGMTDDGAVVRWRLLARPPEAWDFAQELVNSGPLLRIAAGE